MPDYVYRGDPKLRTVNEQIMKARDPADRDWIESHITFFAWPSVKEAQLEAQHGTEQGMNRHVRHGTPYCKACRQYEQSLPPGRRPRRRRVTA